MNNTTPAKGHVGYPTTPQPQVAHQKPQPQTLKGHGIYAPHAPQAGPSPHAGTPHTGTPHTGTPHTPHTGTPHTGHTVTPHVGHTGAGPHSMLAQGTGSAVSAGPGMMSGMLPEETEVITRKKLQELVGQISAGEVLDQEVEEVLLEVVDDFIDSVTTFACSLAKHRNSNTLEVRDLMAHLERNWNIKIPGYGNVETARPFKRPLGTDGHKTRLALVKKSLGPPTKQQKL